jgi:F0F1-type ATP synthase assembly protein I
VTIDGKTARVLEAEFMSCFLMGIGFGMIADAGNETPAIVGALICAASLCLMLSARSLRKTMGDVA